MIHFRSSENSIEIPDSAEIPSTSRDNPEKIEPTRGQHKRHSHAYVFKTQVIMELKNGAKPAELVARYRLNRSLFLKWMKNKEEISQAAVGEHKNMLRIRKSGKYNDLFKELRDVFLIARENGRSMDFNWLWSKRRRIYKKQQGPGCNLAKTCYSKLYKEKPSEAEACPEKQKNYQKNIIEIH